MIPPSLIPKLALALQSGAAAVAIANAAKSLFHWLRSRQQHRSDRERRRQQDR